MSRSIFEHDSLQDIIHKHKQVFFLFCFVLEIVILICGKVAAVTLCNFNLG